MKRSLSDMAREAERLEAARLAGKLICPVSKEILRLHQTNLCKLWYVVPCRLGCSGCDRPAFLGHKDEESLKEAFRQAAMVEEMV